MQNYSVLMSVYKKVKADELRQSIESMLLQTVKPEQFVVVYDGPVEDNVKVLVDSYREIDPGLFTIVPLAENRGLAYALNRGLQVTRNEYIARMDSDDYSLPNRCEKEILFLENNKDYAFVGTSTKNFTGEIQNTIPYAKKRALSYDEIKKEISRNCPFCHPSVMFRKSVVLDCGGYDDELTRSQDYDLFSKILWKGYKAENLEDVLFLYRVDEGFNQRTRSRESCSCRIKIQKKLLQRGQCSLNDYLYIWSAMKITRILPTKIYEKMYRLIKG